MIMIVVLHLISHGGLLETDSQIELSIVMIVRCLCIISVNIFVLISGYFLCTQKFRLSKLIALVFEVWFYSWFIYLALCFSGKISLSFTDLKSALLPISFKEYWFITAYIGMYSLMPLLNLTIERMSRNQHKYIIAIMLLLSVVWHDIIPFSNPLGLSNGYSVLWFIVLYIIAAYIRKYDYSIKRPFLLYLCGAITMFLIWLLLHQLRNSIGILKEYKLEDYYYNYCSVLNLFSSVSLFVFFLRKNIRKGKQIISVITPLTLGVYLIHDNVRLRKLLWPFTMNLISMPFYARALFSVVIIFFGCLIVDYLRSKLFLLIFSASFWKRIDEKIISKLKN